MVLLGGCFTISSITLLGDGLDHLLFFLPLAAFNFVVGISMSERVARLIFAAQFIVIFAALGYQLYSVSSSLKPND